MLRPLDLHEVRDHVAEFLTRHDLTICARVSKEWRISFEPRIWKHVAFLDLMTSRKKTTSQDEALLALISSALVRHAPSIQGIDVSDKHSSLLQHLYFPRLLSLAHGSLHFDPALMTMIQSHQQTLTCLSIKHVYASTVIIPSQFWKQLIELTALKALTIESSTIYLEDWELLWTILSSRLTSLSLMFVRFRERYPSSSAASTAKHQDPGISLASMLSLAPLPLPLPLPMAQSHSRNSATAYMQLETVVSTIQTLKLQYIAGWPPVQQFGWVQACPRIRSLTWMLGYDDLRWDSNNSLLDLLMENIRRFPELTYLELEEDNHTPDTMLAFLVSRTPGYRPVTISTTESSFSQSSPDQFRGLDIMSHTFDSPCWMWMTRHLDYFKTVSVLNFASTPSVTGAMAQEMLCCLPNLQSFSANNIQDRSIWDDPRPWVCLRLERLLLNFQLVGTSSTQDASSTNLTEVEPTARQIQTMTMYLQRLSNLKYLKLLDLSNYGSMDDRRITHLDLRLGHGLEQLSSLQELEEFVVQRMSLNLEEAEIEWMVTNWPRLRTLDGTIHQVSLTDFKIREHFWSYRRKTRPGTNRRYILR